MSSPPAIKKSKSFYANRSKKNERQKIEANLKGFLVSCNFQEKQCVRESYNILNHFADKLYPLESAKDDKAKDCDADELEEELKALKSEKNQPRRFQVMDSGAKNFLFISTTLENPVELTETIVKDIYANKQQQTRFLLRLIPVETTCKAFLDDIKKAVTALAEKHFKEAPKTFSVMYNHRNNDNLNRDEITKTIAEIVSATRSDHKVDLKNAEKTIIIEVIRNYAFLGVVSDYFKYKKYNLVSLSANEEPKTETVVETEKTTE